MGRLDTLARAWRGSPYAFIPPALALAGVLLAEVWASHAPGLGRTPYAVPWLALLGWYVVGLRPLARYAPRPRRGPDGDEPVAAVLLLRWPLGAAVLGMVGMTAYYLLVGAVVGDSWWTTASGADVAARVYGMFLQGAVGGLLIWELGVGADARRMRADERRHT